MSRILDVYNKIAHTTHLAIDLVEQPNNLLQVGIFNTVMGSMKQVNFLKAEIPPVQKNQGVDTSHNDNSGRGEIFVPNEKDFYMGEGVY